MHMHPLSKPLGGATPPSCWPLWNKPPFLPLTWGLLLATSQHSYNKWARQAASWFIGSPTAMLSLGKWLSSKAHLLLVLFTGLGRTDLNYLRFPLVNTTETRGVCVCVRRAVKDGRREWRSGTYRDWEGENTSEQLWVAAPLTLITTINGYMPV